MLESSLSQIMFLICAVLSGESNIQRGAGLFIVENEGEGSTAWTKAGPHTRSKSEHD